MQDIKVSPALVGVIQNRLMLQSFAELMPEEQLQTIQDASELIKLSDVLRTDKSRLIAFLEVLLPLCGEDAKNKIDLILEIWRTAPL